MTLLMENYAILRSDVDQLVRAQQQQQQQQQPQIGSFTQFYLNSRFATNPYASANQTLNSNNALIFNNNNNEQQGT